MPSDARFFFYMRQHYVFTLVESEVERFRNFVHALACKAGSETGHIRRESVILLLRVFYWDIFVQFKRRRSGAVSDTDIRRSSSISF